MSNKQVFDNVYKKNQWFWGSGTGSVAFLNKPVINFINDFLSAHDDVKVIVDLGCGDLQIGENFLLKNRAYIGCDVSSHIIKKNSRKFSKKNMKFLVIDAVNEDIPNGDLIIVKDVLIHLPNSEVKKILRKISHFKYIIIQTCIGDSSFFDMNQDIKAGRNWRFLDVTKSPFNYRKVRLKIKYFEGLYTIPFRLMKLFHLPVFYNGIFTNF